MVDKLIFNRAYPLAMSYRGPRARITGSYQIVNIPLIEQWAAGQLANKVEESIIQEQGSPLYIFCWFNKDTGVFTYEAQCIPNSMLTTGAKTQVIDPVTAAVLIAYATPVAILIAGFMVIWIVSEISLTIEAIGSDPPSWLTAVAIGLLLIGGGYLLQGLSKFRE